METKKDDSIQIQISACQVMSKMLGGFHRAVKEDVNLFKCHNYDETKDPCFIQKCEIPVKKGQAVLDKVCSACRAKYFMECADWAMAHHITDLLKKNGDIK